jgi:Fe-S-cluster containining protein
MRGAPHPEGACAFLDAEGACRVYADRPYVCRTQGLPLRWILEEEGAECRDVCELNDAPIAGAWPTILELPEEACFTLGGPEERLRELQRALSSDDPLGRVRLRDLFHKG